MATARSKALKGERILPGHTRRKTEISHTKDEHGTVVSYRPTNYKRKEKKDYSNGPSKGDKGSLGYN
jgi:hypothetical protein